MKYNDNGVFKDIYVKASDTLPVGAEVEFDGENIPGGYEVSINPNLFDGTTIVSGKGLNGTTGQPYDAASRSYYEYMEALENRTYILKDITPASICFYDSTQTFISSVSGEMTFTTPVDTAYIRVAFNNTVPYTGASLTRQIQRIKKVEQSIGVLGKVLNAQSSSNQDTYSCEYINDLNTYSTTEQRIGTWKDGKPLYRKVVEDTTNSTTAEKNIICANNVSEITKWYGDIVFGTNSKLPLNYYVDSSNFSIAYNDINSSGNGRVRITTTQLSKPVIITMEYTKTTD